MDAHNGDAQPCTASLEVYWIPPWSDSHTDAGAQGRATDRSASWNGRAVIVAIAAATVILAVVSVVVRGLPR
ncbi:hypothetical protein [Streptomyces incarnatus]|uniref:hypothetical protein n=1 Tax=Streptomyces incarnatus TaxID=665007 RepID=UPI000A61E50B|nr:hypothetical protein [Streptomyces incarnatus]